MAWMPVNRSSALLHVHVAVVRQLLMGAVIAYAATSLLLGGSSFARWVFYAAFASWGCLVLAVAYLPALHQRTAKLSWARSLHVLELVSVNLALTLGLAEAGLRLVAIFSGRSLLLSDAVECYRLAPGRDYGQGLRGNSLGYPGADFIRKKQPEVFRIAALGDSFAVGPAVPFAQNYLTLLEKSERHIEVYNFGVSGTGPREYQLILQQDGWTYQPDLVLVSIFVGNDISELLATPRQMDPRHSVLYLSLTRGWRLLRERSRQAQTPQQPAADRLAGGGLSKKTFLEVEARRLAICFKSPPANLEKKWLRAFGHLERIVRDCQAHRKPVAVILIPDEFQVNGEVLHEAMAAAGVQADEVDLQLPQRRLKHFFTSHHVPCLDLLPAFANQPNTYAPCDTHWNERGNRLAAQCIVQWLSSFPDEELISRLAGARPRPAP